MAKGKKNANRSNIHKWKGKQGTKGREREREENATVSATHTGGDRSHIVGVTLAGLYWV
jgi:hypothetical protein